MGLTPCEGRHCMCTASESCDLIIIIPSPRQRYAASLNQYGKMKVWRWESKLNLLVFKIKLELHILS